MAIFNLRNTLKNIMIRLFNYYYKNKTAKYFKSEFYIQNTHTYVSLHFDWRL